MTAARNIDLSNLDKVTNRSNFLPVSSSKGLGLIFGAMLLFLTMINAASAQAPAPQYTQDPIPEKYNDWGRKVIRGAPTDEERENIVRMLHGADGLQSVKLTQFFNDNVFPYFTQLNVVAIPPDPKNPDKPLGTQLTRYRTDFKKAFLTISDIADPGIAKSSREKLNAVIVERMSQIVRNQDKNKAAQNYHPLARYNAAAMLAELNNNDAADGGAAGKQPFMSNSPQLGSLMALLSLSTPGAIIPDSARVAALRGVHRHVAAYGQGAPFTADFNGKINTGLVLPWLNATEPPATAVNRDGHDWIRRRVVEIAVELNNKQPNAIPNLIPILEKIVNEEPATIELRLAAIEGLASQKQLPADINLEALCVSMSKVAVAATRREIHLIESAVMAPSTAKELKAELAQIEAAMKPHQDKSEKGKALATALTALSKACDTKWWDPNGGVGAIAPPSGQQSLDPDALVKALRKTGAELDKIVTGNKESDLMPQYIKIPRTKVTVTNGITPGGVGGGQSSGFRGRGRMEE